MKIVYVTPADSARLDVELTEAETDERIVLERLSAVTAGWEALEKIIGDERRARALFEPIVDAVGPFLNGAIGRRVSPPAFSPP